MYQQGYSNNQKRSPNILIRALWFVFIGWWVGMGWLAFGYSLCLTIIGLPIGLLLLNRLPTVLTLRQLNPDTRTVYYPVTGQVMFTSVTQQANFLTRALYFLFIGWWFGFIWCCVAYLACFSIILLPIGLLMFNRVPAVLTLRRN